MSQFMTYKVAYGDSLQQIAQDHLGDASRWVEIALLNKLDYPFIVDELTTTLENVKTPGETILVPGAEEEVTSVPKMELSDLYDRAFGEDLSLFPEDHIINFNGDNEGELSSDVYGDVKTVRGIANLRQAIIMRLSTPLGTLIRHPEYGSTIVELAGRSKTFDNVHRVKIELERAVRCDSRVQDVIFEQFYDSGDRIVAKMAIIPVGYDTAFKMSLAFGEGGVIEWA
ncbi:hypothetical protein D3C74_50840 [compost metagenome]